MAIKGPKGANDIMSDAIGQWNYIEEVIRNLMTVYNYEEIRTPIFEHTELFLRGIGDTTDIVDKEMYTFLDKGNRSVTLRPEGTASVARAFVEHHMYANHLPAKYYYMGPMFRYSRPQAGRYRQFHQFGVEVLGSVDPNLDGEVIGLAMDFFNRLGIEDLTLLINSVGCPKCRPLHKEALKRYLEPRFNELCPTCQNRYDKNPLRIFDCKSETCQEIIAGAPTITDCLCEECEEHFEGVKTYLELLYIPYEIDEKMVRGLDYYTKTAFEIIVGGIGAQSSIGGGGRYDGLVQEIGGPDVPGIGFAIGLERVLLTLAAQNVPIKNKVRPNVFVAVLDTELVPQGIELVAVLRENNIPASLDVMGRKFKAQFKYANKIEATHVITVGEDEVRDALYPLKDMDTGEEEKQTLLSIIEELKGE